MKMSNSLLWNCIIVLVGLFYKGQEQQATVMGHMVGNEIFFSACFC